MTTALVIGGTGPSGVSVVEGLLDRGTDVTILHRGIHETDYSRPVHHIHADPHFIEPLRESLAGLSFDVTVCMYGRTRLVAEVMKGQTARFVMISGVFYRGWVDGRLLTGPASHVPNSVVINSSHEVMTENSPLEVSGRFSELAIDTERLVREAHTDGHYAATILRYPQVYGPRQPAPLEWCLIRRAMDGRHTLILPDGGLSLQTRLYAENAAALVLATVDHPELSAGEVFNAGDAEVLSYRDWAEIVGEAIGFRFEIASLPCEWATPAHPYALRPWNAGHRILSIDKARTLLHYEPVSATEGLTRTAEWYRANPLELNGEVEQRLGDPFDYVAEDAILAEVGITAERLSRVQWPMQPYVHPYDHPKQAPC